MLKPVQVFEPKIVQDPAALVITVYVVSAPATLFFWPSMNVSKSVSVNSENSLAQLASFDLNSSAQLESPSGKEIVGCKIALV